MSAASTIPAPPSSPPLVEHRAREVGDRFEALARRARFTSDVGPAELAVVGWELLTSNRELADEVERLRALLASGGPPR